MAKFEKAIHSESQFKDAINEAKAKSDERRDSFKPTVPNDRTSTANRESN